MTRLQAPARSVTSGVWSTGCAGCAVRVDAIERALAGEASCSDLLRRITAARGAINGLMAEVLEEHVREYLSPADVDADPLKADAAEELRNLCKSQLQ